jgi:hypothetical protein
MIQGMAGRDDKKVGKKLKTPQGFPRSTKLFADMARHFSGTWFEDIECQDDLHRRAVIWERKLSGFAVQVVEDAMAEVIERGDFKSPSLPTMLYLCQRITDEKNSPNNREAAKAARDRAMAEIRQGVIRG